VPEEFEKARAIEVFFLTLAIEQAGLLAAFQGFGELGWRDEEGFGEVLGWDLWAGSMERRTRSEMSSPLSMMWWV
jgi:hypothetical protein